MQLKLCGLLLAHNIETFPQPFGLGLFLLVAVNLMHLPVLYISLVDHIWVKHVHMERILEWREGYFGVFE